MYVWCFLMEESQLNTRVPLELKKEIKKIALREDTTVEDIVIKQLQEYVKVHGEGNPIYALDKWQEPNFKAVPAFLTGLEKWGSYLENCKPDEIQEIRNQAYAIKSYIDKRYST